MSENCIRCGGAIFLAEVPMIVPGGKYHQSCFKCKECGTKLTLKTYTSKHDSVWCKRHVPADELHAAKALHIHLI